jgi:flagellar motor protein MotB
LSAISYADTRPIDDNLTEKGRARNRRIEIYLILDEKLQH